MPPKAVIVPIAMKAKELKKGGKPAQVQGRHTVALEENKSLIADLFAGEAKVQGFRLSFEVDRHIYDIVEVVQCLHSAAVATLLGLFLST